MHNASGLPFKGFVSQLVACLEDADGSVRETAKSTIVELFRTAPEHAKTDLKRQMTAHNVRRAIFSFIVQHLGSTGAAEADLGASVMSASTASTSHFQAEPSFAESTMSEQPPASETVALDPIYIHTQRELEDTFRDMAPPFEGRETEFNWSVRDKSVMKIRRMLKGNAPSDFHVAFVAGIKAMLDNILKVANTLRTTMSTNGCQLVQELYKSLGTAMDPMTELFMQNFIKMSAFTKKIAAENANTTVETILSNTSYSQRLMQHIWLTFQEKNVQTRSFGPQWLRILLRKNASHKSHVEHSGGLEVIEKCIKKGLEDANPKVRENTRHTYWVFAQIWPGPAEK
jgi:CLIP-associating protein 1/2